jgi:hypothetical protein
MHRFRHQESSDYFTLHAEAIVLRMGVFRLVDIRMCTLLTEVWIGHIATGCMHIGTLHNRVVGSLASPSTAETRAATSKAAPMMPPVQPPA